MLQLDSIMQLDTLLPSQYFPVRRKQTPERRLMIAVVYEALHCLEKHRFATELEGRRLFREAQDWFLADEKNWPYSFECICALLDLESDAVRERLGVLLQREARPRRVPIQRTKAMAVLGSLGSLGGR